MVLDSLTLGPLKKDENGCVTIQFSPIALRISNTLRFGCAECNTIGLKSLENAKQYRPYLPYLFGYKTGFSPLKNDYK